MTCCIFKLLFRKQDKILHILTKFRERHVLFSWSYHVSKWFFADKPLISKINLVSDFLKVVNFDLLNRMVIPYQWIFIFFYFLSVKNPLSVTCCNFFWWFRKQDKILHIVAKFCDRNGLFWWSYHFSKCFFADKRLISKINLVSDF